MSNTHETYKEPSDRELLFSALGIIGVILIFVLIVVIAYIPNRPESVDLDRAAERSQILAENRATQQRLATTYDWVDRENGKVRIPTAVAMDIAINKLNEKEVKASSLDATR